MRTIAGLKRIAILGLTANAVLFNPAFNNKESGKNLFLLGCHG